MNYYVLVVIGAHSGIWLKSEIENINNKNILLVEPVPYNYKVLEKKYSQNTNIKICKNAIFDIKEKRKFFFLKQYSLKKLKKKRASGIC